MIAIIHMLYHGLRTDFVYAGDVVTTISLHSGIRQTCPYSGTIFALSLDPFVRWYLSRSIFTGTHIYLYADDLANAMRDIYRHLLLILCALHHWRLASGLALKPPKCVVLPLWVGDCTEIRNFVGNRPGFSPDAVRTSARYLGVDLGVETAASRWLSVAPRITRHAHDIRTAGATLPTRVALHNAHVSSIVRYRAAFFPPSPALLRTYHHSEQIVFNAPWQTVPAAVLHDLRGLGFRADIVDIGVMRGHSLAPGRQQPRNSPRLGSLRRDAGQRRRRSGHPPKRCLRPRLAHSQQLHPQHARPVLTPLRIAPLLTGIALFTTRGHDVPTPQRRNTSRRRTMSPATARRSMGSRGARGLGRVVHAVFLIHHPR